MQRQVFAAIGFLIFMWTASVVGQDGPLRFSGWLSGGGQAGSGPDSWLTGGIGKLANGDEPGDTASARGHFGLTYEPNLYFKAHVHGLARAEPSQNRGEAFGIPEAYLQAKAYWHGNQNLRLRMGWFFPSTSLENVAHLWASPYTLSFSAINSWIGEEMRTAGLDVRYTLEKDDHALYVEGSLLAGNDSLGAMLAWRGWSMGQRLSVWDEALPLLNLTSFQTGAAFALQNPLGTVPLTDDLDGDYGYSARLGYEQSGLLLLLNYLDNRGDRKLHYSEYAWETHFWQTGVSVQPHDNITLLGEYLDGETGMGQRSRAHAQVAFASWYLLTSFELEALRLSLRYDKFRTRDLDRLNGNINPDNNDERGDAITAAAMWEPTDTWRLALEWLALEADRSARTTAGVRNHERATTWTLEARYHF